RRWWAVATLLVSPLWSGCADRTMAGDSSVGRHGSASPIRRTRSPATVSASYAATSDTPVACLTPKRLATPNRLSEFFIIAPRNRLHSISETGFHDMTSYTRHKSWASTCRRPYPTAGCGRSSTHHGTHERQSPPALNAALGQPGLSVARS